MRRERGRGVSAEPAWPSVEEFKQKVLELVEERDFVTFARLHKALAGDAREPTEMSLPGNRVIWTGLPKPLIDAVLALLEEGRVAAVPGSKAAYKADGRVLKLPVEKGPPREPHAEPHWFPVFLRPMASVLAEQDDTD